MPTSDLPIEALQQALRRTLPDARIEAVALPNADRDILGLSALRRLQSFSLQFEPAALTFSNC